VEDHPLSGEIEDQALVTMQGLRSGSWNNGI
jgi:hypothetical protein